MTGDAVKELKEAVENVIEGAPKFLKKLKHFEGLYDNKTIDEY